MDPLSEAPLSEPATSNRFGRRRLYLIGVLSLQVLCILFLGTEAALDIVGIELEDLLGTRNFLEFAVVSALVLGAVFVGNEIRALLRRQRAMEDQLMAVSGAFHELLEKHFEEWGLTASERDVALLAIKGLSIAEIAEIRQTASGTVKAQSNKIYAKAGVSGRPQLLSVFIEELMNDGLLEHSGA